MKENIEKTMKKINVAILGASGSIGSQTLSVIDAQKERFSVYALSVGSDWETLKKLANRYGARYIGIDRNDIPADEAKLLPKGTELIMGEKTNAELAAMPGVDLVVIAMPGMKAIHPLISAMKNGKKIAIANKECLVCGGDYVRQIAKENNTTLYPIDSEQSAIFQCLQGLSSPDEIKRLILTASGGPFRTWKKEDIDSASPAQALAHPNWKMGKKISIDSASLVNKGLELIEAHYLFDVAAEKIDVVIHPQSIIHSMVETIDGAFLAQMGSPDMRLPIQYAMSFPERWESPADEMDIFNLKDLTFEKPDYERFRGLKLAYDALEAGDAAPIIYNAVDEVAVDAFLKEKIGFATITNLIETALDKLCYGKCNSLDEILAVDFSARIFTEEYIAKLNNA